MSFTDQQIDRYSRHILLKEIGIIGQEKLMSSRVLIIGAGGLGSPVAMYLTAAGVGTIGIADADVVDLSNLQRQILHTESDLGVPKVESAVKTLEAMNSATTIIPYPYYINRENILELVQSYDFIIDATDNFDSKFLINDACVLAKKPFCHGGITKFQGQIMTYVPNQGPCYRCIFREPPSVDGCATCKQGVIGALCGVIGSLQAMEAIKYLTGAGELLTGYLLTYDALTMNFRKIKLPTEVGDCPVCGEHTKIMF